MENYFARDLDAVIASYLKAARALDPADSFQAGLRAGLELVCERLQAFVSTRDGAFLPAEREQVA